MQPVTPQATPKSPRRLPLVAPSAEMSGKFPRGAERIARSCSSGDREHRALIFTSVSVAGRAVQLCVPPSLRRTASAALREARAWGLQQTDYRAVRKWRAALFDALPELQERTCNVFTESLRAQESSQDTKRTALTEHANLVLQRYLALGVQHSISGVLLCLDAIVDAPQALDIPQEAAGGITYRDLALGPARDPELQALAIQRAEWEQRSLPVCRSQPQGSIALQLYHEYLGVHFNERSQAHRLYLERFIEWALPG